MKAAFCFLLPGLLWINISLRDTPYLEWIQSFCRGIDYIVSARTLLR